MRGEGPRARPHLAVVCARVALLLAVAVAGLPGAHAARESVSLAHPLGGERPEVQVPRLAGAPSLEAFLGMRPDGDIERQMTRVTGFVQRDPEDGQPASQRTDVYLGYDDRNFYTVFVAFDDEPERMRASMNRRENVFGDETVEIQLDTFHDQRRAFSFLTNPYGIQWDAIWTEGQGFDQSFDTVWSSAGSLTETGYVVWMAIPFKSLRFSPDPEQRWGVVLVRDIPRNNETSFWPRVSNRVEGRLNQAGVLDGLSDISPGRNLQLIPYATSRSIKIVEGDETAASITRDDADNDLGLDAKLVFKDSMALDLTLNPDFSQVESDEPQVTVNQRFEVFFPEKRPFFLENASFFQTPINLLFTRRIGDPRAGARLTGKLGQTTVGALLIDDEAPGARAVPGEPGVGEDAFFGVLRVGRDIFEQSNVGAIYTQRTFEGASNRVGGVDGRIKIGENWDSRFQAVASRTRLIDGTEMSGPAYNLSLNRSGRKFNTHVHYQDFSPGFQTDSGFVTRTDLRSAHQSTSYTFRPEGKKLISWQPGLFTERILDHSGDRLDWRVNPSIGWDFRRQTNLRLFAAVGRERLRVVDFPGLPSDTDFDDNSFGFFFRTHFVAPFQFNANLSVGDGINFVPPAGLAPSAADELTGSLELSLRPLSRLQIDNRYLFTRLEDSVTGGRVFTNEILRSRWNWQFTRRFSIRTILEYTVTRPDPALSGLVLAKSFNTDLLFTYRANPWTAIFVGYNTNRSNLALQQGMAGPQLIRTRDDFLEDARQFFVKVSYLFRP